MSVAFAISSLVFVPTSSIIVSSTASYFDTKFVIRSFIISTSHFMEFFAILILISICSSGSPPINFGMYFLGIVPGSFEHHSPNLLIRLSVLKYDQYPCFLSFKLFFKMVNKTSKFLFLSTIRCCLLRLHEFLLLRTLSVLFAEFLQILI